MDHYAEALNRFQSLFARGQTLGLKEPDAVTVATVDEKGHPTMRTVLLKFFDTRGFVFYTNLSSRKGTHIQKEPHVALCFYWDDLREQVTVEGVAETVSVQEADAYWASRPRESQIGALASQQSQPLESYESLLERVEQLKQEYEGKELVRPEYWSGFRVMPQRIEFWKGKTSRLNERVVYTKHDEVWTKQWLSP